MRPRRALTLLSCALAIGAVALAAHAGKVYKWTDRNGVIHYGDRPPPNAEAGKARNVSVIPVRAEPGAMARLRVESNEGTLHGLGRQCHRRPDRSACCISPAATTSSANRRCRRGPRCRPVAVHWSRGCMSPIPAAAANSSCAWMASPAIRRRGRATSNICCRCNSAGSRIDQGYGGSFSHVDPQNRYALDFAANEGTPVLAAREGVVMQVESDFDKAGLNREKYGGRANFVRIVHDDGSMALYAHLKPEGVLVRTGQRVRAGQRIGLSGNTGFTTGPHLHFAVQVNRGMRLESIPFRMQRVTPLAARR